MSVSVAPEADGRQLSERGKKRKVEILDAALLIIARDGLSNLTMRTLAAEARIPLGATTYYFSSKSAIITDAFQLHAERETARVFASTRGISPGRSVEALANELANFLVKGLTQHRNQLIAEYELLIGATREQGLAALSRSWQVPMRRELRDVARRLGSPKPAVDAQVLLALLAGLEVDHLSAEPSATDSARIRSILRRSVSALFPSPKTTKGDQRVRH